MSVKSVIVGPTSFQFLDFHVHDDDVRRRIQHRHFGLRRCVSMSQRRMTQVVMLNPAPHVYMLQTLDTRGE